MNKLDLDITESNEDIEKLVDSKSLLSLKNNLQDYEKELKQIIEELKIATIESKNYNSIKEQYDEILKKLNDFRATIKSSTIILNEKDMRKTEVILSYYQIDVHLSSSPL